MEKSESNKDTKGPKTYPNTEDDIKYEQEIIDEIKKLPLE